jgi:hypothetical protein
VPNYKAVKAYLPEGEELEIQNIDGTGGYRLYESVDCWRDITGQILTRGVPATDPTWTVVDGGPFSAWAFSVGDTVWISYHIPHDIVPSTDIHFHTHWMPDGTDTNNVKWEYTYTYAKGFDQEAFNTTGTAVTSEEAGPGTAWQHMVTESAAVTISGLTEPDGIIYVRLKRDTPTGGANSDTIFVLTADIHYRSTNYGTLGKAPDFYA